MSKQHHNHKPVVLQFNSTGAWRNCITFDAANERKAAKVMKHAVELARIGNSTLRIVSTDSSQPPLAIWAEDTGWVDFVTRKPLS